MLEARHFTASAKAKGSYALPEEFDGRVNRAALYHAVRAYRNNQRQGTHSTKTRSEVSGGSRKPWRQKGTGRARQGTIRAPQWVGGGVAFGPKPRSYRTDLPRKVRRLARQSALNARANTGALCVIEELPLDAPKTRQLAELIEKLGLAEQKVLILTPEARPEVYLSGRNLPAVHVMRYVDASAYDVLWSDTVVVEEGAIGGRAVKAAARGQAAGRAKRATAKQKATKATKRARKKAVKRSRGRHA